MGGVGRVGRRRDVSVTAGKNQNQSAISLVAAAKSGLSGPVSSGPATTDIDPDHPLWPAPDHPRRCARRVVKITQRDGTPLHHWHDEWYRWCGTHYEELSEKDIHDWLFGILENAKYRREREHHRRDQDPGERYQADRPDAAVLRGARHGSLHARGPVSAAARHPDRRRRERRRDDERVPAQVLAGRPRVLELRDTDPQRHRVPRAPVRQRSPRGGAAHDTAAPAAPRLGADDAG